MFDWLFKPKCPCDPHAKAWVEYRLKWLSRQFPESAFSGEKPVITPTPEFFPVRFDGTEGAAEDLMDYVCLYMGVNRHTISVDYVDQAPTLHLVNNDGLAVGGAAGTFQSGARHHRITIDRSEFTNVEGLVGTMAHELAHVRLLGEGRLDGSEFDNELLTDLTTVHLGMGLFLANGPRDWMSGYTHWPETTKKKPEYMNRPMYGWALALLAHFRGETRPAWAQHLTHWPRREMAQGQRFLEKTRASTYLPSPLRLLN